MNRRIFLAASSSLAMCPISGAMAEEDEPTQGKQKMENETYVLVHGAWHGGWCWKYVEQRLSKLGHRVFTPTLTGLGSRRNLLDEHVGLDTHISDVAELIRLQKLENIVLVGHSYGGMVISGVADQVRSKIKRIVYLDALVPDDGQSLLNSGLSDDPERLEQGESQIRAMSEDGISIAAPPAVVFGIPETDQQHIEWVDKLLTPHPVKTLLDKISLSKPAGADLPRTYIFCTEPLLFQSHIPVIASKIKNDPSWQYLEIETGHDAMVTEPALLTDLLIQPNS